MADARSIALVCATEASLWAELRSRAEKVSAAEPVLAPALKRFVLDRASLGEAVVERLADRLAPSGDSLPLLQRALADAVASAPEALAQRRADIRATLERDPATEPARAPVLWYTG
ncbi:MAG: hypothetical protein ACKORI_04175, partial [Verrucomicrobiota bacterium]